MGRAGEGVVNVDRFTWEQRALCAQIDPEIWFWNDGGYALAKRLCRRCPVLRTCLEQVLADESGRPANQRIGVWGGMGPATRYREERRRLAKATS